MTIKINNEQLKGIEEVRDSGLTNMFDYNKVQKIALEKGHIETVKWMQDNKQNYAQLIMGSYEITD